LRSLKALTAADPLAAQTQKNRDGLIKALYIFDIEMPDAELLPNLGDERGQAAAA
jgi:hypothetical protein